MANLTGYDKFQIISVTGNKPAAPLSWFPMLVALDADAGLNDHTQNGGLDIAFCVDDDNTPLPYEGLVWTDLGATVTARFWVRVPTVAAVADTDLRMHIGKAAGTAYAPISDVWNENGAGNYAGVWHLNNSLLDSTANARTLTNVGATGSATGGQVAGYYLFGNLESDYLQVEDGITDAYPITMSCLFYAGDVTQHHPLMFLGDKDETDFYIAVRARGDVVGDPVQAFHHRYALAGAAPSVSSTAGYGAAAWHSATGIQIGQASRSAFIDGGNKGVDATAAGAAMNGNDRFAIGAYRDFTPFYGAGTRRIEEARISTITRSDDWVAFKHDNIFDYAATITHGAWESAAAGIAVLRRRIEGY